MSTELSRMTVDGKEIILTRFYGGSEKGACLQITFGSFYTTMTKAQLGTFIKHLQDAYTQIKEGTRVLTKINYSGLPEHIQGGMRRYIDEGVLPGHFLQAVIQDKLAESFMFADDTNIKRMFDIVKFMYNEAPSICHGSSEKMELWHEKGGLNGGGDIE